MPEIGNRVRAVFRMYWIVLLGPFLLLGPILARGQVIFWGTPALQFIPWWVYAWENLRQGLLPLWNPLNGMGAPLIANYQLAFFYPPNWLLLAFAALGGAPWVAWGFTLLAALHLAWAGLGMSLLIRRLGLGWLGQVIGGLAFGLSGFMVGRLGFFSMVWAAAWLPWVIVYADRIASPVEAQGNPRQAERIYLPPLGLVLSLAMMLLAGHAQLSWYGLVLLGTWVLAGSLRQGGGRRIFTSMVRLASAGLLAAGIAAVQLVPTFEYLLNSQRSDAFAYDEAMTYSFWPWRVISIFSPDFFGNPFAGDYWGYATYWEDHLYPGLLALILAIATLWLLRKRALKENGGRYTFLILLGWGIILLSFLLALGNNTPVFPFLYHYVPTFEMFQAPARFLLWTAFFVPLLAAVSSERWRCPTGRGLYWFRLTTAGSFAIMLGAGLGWVLAQEIKLTFVRATALMGFWGLGFGLLTLLIPAAQKHGRMPVWRAGVIGWLLVDLLVTGWSTNISSDMRIFEGSAPITNRQPLADGLRIYMPLDDEYSLKFQRFLRFADFRPLEDWRNLRAVLLPNINLLESTAVVRNFDPLVPGRYTSWLELIEEQAGAANQSAWLADAGVGLREEVDGSQPFGVRFETLPGAQRWRWFTCVQWASDQQQSQAMLRDIMAKPEGPGGQALIVEGGQPGESRQCPEAAGVQPEIRKTVDSPARLELEIHSSSDGWLYVADTWYPGWQASIDGQSAEIYPANLMFRAVRVPAGLHKVAMFYRPFGFYFGAFFSILVLSIMLVLRGFWANVR